MAKAMPPRWLSAAALLYLKERLHDVRVPLHLLIELGTDPEMAPQVILGTPLAYLLAGAGGDVTGDDEDQLRRKLIWR